MIYFKIAIFVLVIVVLIGISLWYLMDSTVKINKKLDVLERKVKKLKTKEELENAYEELKEISKECWHKSFGMSIMKIQTIIITKYEMLNEK